MRVEERQRGMIDSEFVSLWRRECCRMTERKVATSCAMIYVYVVTRWNSATDAVNAMRPTSLILQIDAPASLEDENGVLLLSTECNCDRSIVLSDCIAEFL